MKIGGLAQVAQCTVESVRYDEKEGLLPEPARTAGNFRVYGPAHLVRLQELTQLQRQLTRLRQRCSDEQATDDCGILQGLAAMATEQKPERHNHLG